MRKIIVFNMVTLDGLYAGPNGDISWHVTDDEFNKFAIEQTPTFGALIFGRVTYDLMASYWPSPDAIKDDPIVAGIMNNIPKIVFSKTLRGPQENDLWKHVTVYSDIVPEEIMELKKQQGRDIAIFGSGTIVQEFTNRGLIDEYRLMVNPVILGEGKPLFQHIGHTLHLRLLSSKTFHSGNVLLSYGV